MRRFFWLVVFLAGVAGLGAGRDRGAVAAADPAALDGAFREFWSASDQNAAAKRIDAILKTSVSFDEALARVRRGRDYSAGVARGLQRGRIRTSSGLAHPYILLIPENQVENLSKILDRVKRTYNVDEDHVYLTGASDGGTGVYFMAFRDTTPWSSFLPLIGNMTVLANADAEADGQIYPGNAALKAFFIVNGGRDRLYPAHIVQRYVEHLQELGADVVFHVQPDSDHNTDWWPEERAAFEEFVNDHPRDPLPDKLSWETERTDRYNRAHWLIIDRLGDVAGQSDLPDSNLLDRGREYDFGLRIDSGVERGRRATAVVEGSNVYRIGLRTGDLFVEVDGRRVQTGRDLNEPMQEWDLNDVLHFTVKRGGQRVNVQGTFQPDEIDVPTEPIFPRKKPSGRVDLERNGNLVEASTRGVKAFTLLLSPSKFDFSRPVKVVANGRTVFDAVVEPGVDSLLKWAARDNDRMMVFGAELHVDLDK